MPQCRFLLSARKRKKSRSANYIISLDVADTSRHSPHFAGKVRSNFLGTEFVLYDAGDKPGKQRGGELTPESVALQRTYLLCAHCFCYVLFILPATWCISSQPTAPGLWLVQQQRGHRVVPREPCCLSASYSSPLL